MGGAGIGEHKCMKPWRPYWKALDSVMDELLRNIEQPPFSSLDQIEESIQNLKFAELLICDDDCTELLEVLTNENIAGHSYFLVARTIKAKTNWQLILRCECALDFCRGRVGNRKDFNWNQEPKTIFRWLLIDFWRANAAHWACKLYGSPKLEARMRQFRLDQKISNLFCKGDPTTN